MVSGVLGEHVAIGLAAPPRTRWRARGRVISFGSSMKTILSYTLSTSVSRPRTASRARSARQQVGSKKLRLAGVSTLEATNEGLGELQRSSVSFRSSIRMRTGWLRNSRPWPMCLRSSVDSDGTKRSVQDPAGGVVKAGNQRAGRPVVLEPVSSLDLAATYRIRITLIMEYILI